MISKLVISGIEVPITKELPLSANFAISDIRNPDSRGGTFTKSIVLEGSQVLNQLFENIFQLNIDLGTFNPNKKVTAIYYINEKQQVKGDLQLQRILSLPNKAIEYQCNIIGREGSVFVAIGDKYLTDLDFSDLNHTYNKTEQKNSWATSYRKSGVATAFSLGSGYVYPLIKYGYSASNTTYDVTHLKPAIYVKEYFDRIMTAAGYTYTSTFLNSTTFKSLIIPCNIDKIQLSNSDINSSQYYIGKTANTTSTGFASGSTVGTTGYGAGVAGVNIASLSQTLNDEATAPYFDGSGQWDSAVTYQGTIGISGYYNLVAYGQLDVTVNAPSVVGGKYQWVAASAAYLTMRIQTNAGSGWYNIASITNSVNTSTVHNLGTATSFTSNCQTGAIFLGAGSPIRILMDLQVYAYILDAASVNVGNGVAWSMDYTMPKGQFKNEHYLLLANTTVSDGFTMTMNNAIPKNIKQKDFIKSIFQMFNLYMEKDKSNETNLIIEPRDTFYSGTVLDWTDKIDYSKNFEMSPMGELDFRNYIFKYKDDKDYYNDLYQKQYIDNYGLKRYSVDNDFITSDKSTEIIFSPTPIVSNSSNNIINPHIYLVDGTSLKPTNHNIRILYYGGLLTSGNSWSYTSLSGTTSETTYPYAGHVDSPTAPTVDINFWYPREVFYTYPLAYFVDNNLFNAYYSKFISEITDKNSKIVTCYVELNELDVMSFSFRNRVFINHPIHGSAYYYVNKIVDYDPINPKTTKVELLKLKNYSTFVPSNIAIDASFDPAGTARIVYNSNTIASSNTTTTNTIAIGNNNRVMGSGNSVTGSTNCYIDETSSGISLVSCNRVSVVGVTNFVGIGLSDMTIDSTYNNSMLNTFTIGGSTISSMTLTGIDPASPTVFNIDTNVQLYYVDCTGGDVTILFDISTCANQVFYFKRLDASAYLFRIDEVTGLPTVDGNAIPYDTGMPQYDSITVTNNGANFYII